MALLQALLAMLGRSMSTILDAIIGWAVVALFGRVAPSQRTPLTVLVATAAAWPFLLLGIAFPHFAALVVAFIPLHDKAPTWIVRLIWVALALIVPVVVGLVVSAKAPPGMKHEPMFKRVLRGFPVTIGIAAAFFILFITIPALRLASMWRRQRDEHLPLITDAAGYAAATEQIDDVIQRFDLKVARQPPPWWLRTPSKVMTRLSGKALHHFMPDALAYWKGPNLELALYSSDLLVRGDAHSTTFTHAILAECFARGPGLSTYGAEAQEIEREIHQVWGVLDEHGAHVHSKALTRRLVEISQEISHIAVDWDDWQVLYRKALQLGRALEGTGQILQSIAKRDDMQTKIPPAIHAASTGELLTQLVKETGELMKTEMALARSEIREDIRGEVKMVTRGLLAGMFALWTVDLLLAAAVLGIATALPGWAAALLVALGTAIVGGAAGALAYTSRVTSPLKRTQKTLQENVRWAKERLA